MNSQSLNYIERIYSDYLSNAENVSPEWRQFFQEDGWREAIGAVESNGTDAHSVEANAYSPESNGQGGEANGTNGSHHATAAYEPVAPLSERPSQASNALPPIAADRNQ